MKKYEYKYTELDFVIDSGASAKQLNMLGKDGWKIVKIFDQTDYQKTWESNAFNVLLMREIETPEKSSGDHYTKMEVGSRIKTETKK